MPPKEAAPTWRRGRYTRCRELAPRQEDLASNNQPLDLRSALVDLEQLRVAHQLLDGVLLHVAVAPEDLDCVGRHLHGGVRGEALGERRTQRRPPSLLRSPPPPPG